MINLLPADIKQGMRYARRNTRLRHWAVGLVVSILCIGAVIGVGYIYLEQSIHSYAAQVEQGNAQLKELKLDEVQAQVQDLTESLKLVVQVLSREILFSKLISQVGAALPNGSILTNLSINKVQGGIDLQAAATDYQTATQVQLNMQDPHNKIFDKADIINIQCTTNAAASGDAIKAQYPCTIQLRALFTANNPFSFIPKAPVTEAKP